LNFSTGDIGLLVDADQSGLDLGAIVHDHADLVGIRDDVIVGDDDARGIDDEAGAERIGFARRLHFCRSCRRPLGDPPRRFLKKSSKNSRTASLAAIAASPPAAAPALGLHALRSRDVDDGSITFSAMSAMPSGPRALAGTDASKLAALNEIAIPIRRRRRLKAGLAPVMSACLQRFKFGSTVRPNGSAAQASAPDIPAKNRPPAAHDCVDASYLRPLIAAIPGREANQNVRVAHLRIPDPRCAIGAPAVCPPTIQQ
jgi:hypothetical protein